MCPCYGSITNYFDLEEKSIASSLVSSCEKLTHVKSFHVPGPYSSKDSIVKGGANFEKDSLYGVSSYVRLPVKLLKN